MIYDLIAPIYDKINGEIDYGTWADFIEKVFLRFSNSRPDLVLDLGCGTGSMTLELAKRGYDMTGVDYSPEMLNIARERIERAKLDKDVLLLCQDMRAFELYGTVDAAVCSLDGLNHLLNTKDLKKCLSLVHNYLIPDGIFVFDINGKYKFENLYADNTYVMEEDGSLCIWQNDYDEKSKICDFYITLFKENSDGTYSRYDECQSERMYTLRSMKGALAECGFEFLGAYSDFEFNEADDESERLYIAARCKKN